jgi:hypothetical protein
MPRKLKDKHIRLDQTKINRVKKVLGAKTETEAIDKALDLILAEEEINRVLDRIGGKGKIEQVF